MFVAGGREIVHPFFLVSMGAVILNYKMYNIHYYKPSNLIRHFTIFVKIGTENGYTLLMPSNDVFSWGNYQIKIYNN
jgi:hypothetical protein